MPASIDGLTWEASLDRAKQRASQEKKPILVDFSAAPM
jgi:hypothetical protein